MYEGRLQSSWTHLIFTPSLNFVKMRWRSLIRSTSLGKRCTYNAPPTSRKRAADRWSLRNFLPRSALFMVGKAQKSHGERCGQYDVVSKSFRIESITNYTLTTINTRSESTRSLMAAKITRLTHKIAIQLHVVAESCTICSSRSRRLVRKLLDTPS
jgi:hypothetical protein